MNRTASKKRKVAETSPASATARKRKGKELPGTTRVLVSQTGIRSGEFIAGSGAAAGTVLEIFFMGAEYPPSREMVDLLTDVQVRDLFNNFAFFADKTEAERKAYLEEKAIPPTTRDYISDIDNVFVIVHSIGGSGFIDPLNPALYDDLMGRRIPLLELFARIPGGEKTRNKTAVAIGSRHSLIFRPSVWSLKPDVTFSVPDVFISLASGQSLPATLPGNKFKCEITDRDKKTVVAEMIDGGGPPFSMEDYTAVFAFAPGLSEYEPYFNRIKQELGWFSPSVHKSLLQKLIRTRCAAVRLFKGSEVPADAVFIVSFLMLLVHPGAFVPDIQRFVSGAESAFKRIAVAMGEDTHCEIDWITSAFSSALCAQKHPQFKPSVELVANTLVHGLIARNSPFKFKYKTTFADRQIDGGLKWQLPYVLLHTLGSFKSDVALMQWIGLNAGAKQSEREMPPLSVMRIEYCIDQHSLTNIAWFMPVENDMDYTAVFKHLWTAGTGRNSREVLMEETPSEIALAQKLMWLCKSAKAKKEWELYPGRPPRPVAFSLSYSWMAGIMEKLELRLNATPVVVFAHPEARGKFICMRPATRDKANEELSEEMQDAATAQAIHFLSTTGKKVKSDFLGVSGTLKYDPNQMEFLLNDKRWEEIRKGEKTVNVVRPLVEPFKDVLTDAYFATCLETAISMVAEEGAIAPNAHTHIRALLHSVPSDCIARLAMYVRPVRKHIELYRVARDGSSTYLQVSCKDTVVFRVLVAMTCFIPGVLSLESSSQRFTIRDFKSWSSVRAVILSMMSKGLVSQTGTPSPWAVMNFTDTRKLYTHQESAVEVLKDRIRKKQRGNLIWIPVGLGKTLIVNTFITWLIKQKNMPDYCVYSLPPSAFESIKAELRMSGLPFIVVEKTGDAFQPGTVNLIKHDRMRAFATQLTLLAPNCFFVLDEFHLAMNATQRTSIALEITKLAWNFVGMTGTLVKDKGSKGIIDWVSQVVEFEVTERNYWVAVAALVSRKIPLKIVEERTNISVKMTAAELAEYNQFVDPRFGGKADRTNFHEASSVCFGVIERGLIEETLRHARRDQTTPPVFLVARNADTQLRLAQTFSAPPHSLRVFMIDSRNSIRYAYADAKTWDVVITTPTHSTGYTLTKSNIMITAVYFSNQATRDQLDGRLMRLDQKSPVVRIILLHTGLLSYTLNHHEDARALRKAMEDLAVNIG